MAAPHAQQSSAQALIPFTGFYMLNPDTGAFLMVDTHEACTVPAAGGAPVSEYFAAITISPDGQTSNKYPLGSNCIFEGENLVITDGGGNTIANLDFSNASGSVSVSGTIGNTNVAGSTPFGPVPLALWSGIYYAQQPAIKKGGLLEYPYTPTLQIDPDGTVLYAPNGGALQKMSSYWYDYGMFVVGLILDPSSPDTASQLFEMGTATGWGRVAGNATDGQMLVSIQLQELAPHL